MSIVFKSLSSGSCGNCYFLASTDSQGRVQAGVAIDTGVSVRRLKEELRRHGYSPDDIHAVLLTHDHMDHIRSLGSWCKRLSKPVWTSGVLHSCLAGRTISGEDFIACSRVLGEGDWNEVVPGHVKVRYFVVPHDATQTVGYAIVIDSYRFVIMTDIGSMTPEALSWASHAQTVVIESNYDYQMLINGSYTYELKMRILKGHGHLRNEECAEAIRHFYHEGLRNIFLCHLSENNNTPEKAFASSEQVLRDMGVTGKVALRTLPRQSASPLFIL
ncbi:MAG: MBL fold metallo-hydrolase [Bacteroidales bacterium]|nr:MBL fold metallo-hydrolase [Bacteroidales bacterium]